jgi:phosphatidylglycerophosphate synthase
MGGIAAFYLTVFVPNPYMPYTHFFCASVMLGLCLFTAFKNRALPPAWLVGGTPLWYGVGLLGLFLEPSEVAFWVFITMVVLTWVSGADYLWGAARILKQQGVGHRDGARVVWSVVHGLALVPLVGEHPALVVPVIAIVCAELALGGIDNIVSAERHRFSRGSVVPTTLAAIAVGAVAWFSLAPTGTLLVLAWALAAFSLGNRIACFWREREVFLAPDRALPQA